MLNKMLNFLDLTKKSLLRIILGTAILAFAILNVHARSYVTEGGVIGLVLFFNRMFGIDPSITSIILDLSCYAIGLSLLGRTFIKKSIVASIFFASFLKIFKFIGPVFPEMYDKPFVAAVVGGLLVGIGCGLVVTQGGATGGDDAIALSISNKFKWKLWMAYLFSDIVVLGLSLSYIPAKDLIFSVLTTTISSIVVGQLELRLSIPEAKTAVEA